MEREIKLSCHWTDVNDGWNGKVISLVVRERPCVEENKRQMKSAVFARPNLKVFLVGAVLIAVVQDFISKGHSQASFLSIPAHSNAYAGSDKELQPLLEEAKRKPGSQIFNRLSQYYEKRGDIKKAMLYLHRAGKFAEVEDIEN